MSKLPIKHLLMLVKLYGVSADYILGINGDSVDVDGVEYYNDDVEKEEYE